MLKRFFLALAFAGLLSPVQGAGTLPGFSLSQQMGTDGRPLAGCILYIIQAGTTSTPQIAYQDSALTIPAAGGSQLACDAAGRISQFFLADGSVKIRLVNSVGVTQFTADGLLVVGPSGGTGGGSAVDPTTVMQTGHVEAFYGTGTLSGFVRANGRTIGSATSGATERANADTQALFVYLWGVDANLAVSGGRGASAAADWAANKALTLPDASGRALAGLDDMGAGARGRLTSTYFGTATNVLGAVGGSENKTFAQANLPNVSFPVTDPGHIHPAGTGSLQFIGTVGTPNINIFQSGANNFNRTDFTGLAQTGITVNSGGSGTPLAITQPTMLITLYLKL